MDVGTSAVVVAFITAVIAPTWGTLFIARRNAKNLLDVNDAVNHRHQRGDGSPRMYDAILGLVEDMRDMKAWQAQWASLPPELSDAAHVVRRFERIDESLASIVAGHMQVLAIVERLIEDNEPGGEAGTA
jgi:hypothetical protein